MMDKIASDVVMEIIFATNRFSRSDLREFTADNVLQLCLVADFEILNYQNTQNYE